MTASTDHAAAERAPAPGARSSSPPARLALALLPGTVFLVTFLLRASSNPFAGRRFTLFDDAMISMTYARTLVDGGGWVWFPGADRVQGITNPLWTLHMALWHLLGLDGSAASFAVAATGVVLVLVASVMVFAVVRRALEPHPSGTGVAVVGAALVPFIYPFTFWTLRGMEVGLLAVLVLGMLWATPPPGCGAERLAVAVAVGIMGVLTRIDFVVFVLAVSAVALVWPFDPGARADRGQRRAGAILGGAGLLAVVAVLMFQRAYWGDWLPNTYRLKVGGVPLSTRLTRGVVSLGKSLPLLAVVAIATTISIRHGSVAVRRRSIQLAAIVAAAAGYGVWAGGDAWESFLYTSRYLSVALPAALAAVMLGVGTLVRLRAVPRWVGTALLSVPVAALGGGLVSNPYRFHGRFALGMVAVALVGVSAVVIVWGRRRANHDASVAARALVVATFVAALSGAYPAVLWVGDGGLHVGDDQRTTEAGGALAAATTPDAVIAVSWAGALAYHARRPMVDLLGKSDRVVAGLDPEGDFYPGHNKLDYDYSVGGLRPDVVYREAAESSTLGRRLSAWGYARACLVLGDGTSVAAYFLADSPHVRWDALRACP